MKLRNNQYNKFICSEKGASNLEAIILITIALVIGAALMVMGGRIRDTVDTGTNRVDEINQAMQ